MQHVLGAGGMGVVYRAIDPQLGRTVALKVLVSLEGRNRETRELLIQEARAMAMLSHPNLVAVHDVGFAREHAFFAMEYVEGSTLADWLRGQAPTLE